MLLKYLINSYTTLLYSSFLKGYKHVSDITNSKKIEENGKEKWEEITTSNDYSKKPILFGSALLYRGWKNYLKDNLHKIGEKETKEGEERLDINDVVKWTKKLTNEILEPIHGNDIKSLKELEDLLVEKYGAGKVHKYTDKAGKEYNIRFATSFNIKGTTILRKDSLINVEGGITPKATHNLASDNFVGVDAIGWSSIPAAPTGGYNKKQENTNEGTHQGFGLLGKISELRPMDAKFNIELYEKIMNGPIEIEFKGFAYESNGDEIVIMPTFIIKGKKIEESMKQFSQEVPEGKIPIPTSKKYLADL